MKKLVSLLLTVVLCLSCITGCQTASSSSSSSESHTPSISWRASTTGTYLKDDQVTSLVCVEATSQTTARVFLFEKSYDNGKAVWNTTLQCDAVIGGNGLGKTREGDNKTPIGDFGIIQAFGIKKNPGTVLPYTDVTDDIYCCADETAYNQIINIKEVVHDCTEGEHMIDYSPEYNYGLFLDYNSEHIVGNGNAIFFHCKGATAYTGGCIAVDEANMVKILQAVNTHSRVIIDYATDYTEDAAPVINNISQTTTADSDPSTSPELNSSDFVLVSEAVPDAILEIRYYSTYNFVGRRITGYEEPVAMVTKETAEALKNASDLAISMGYRLKIYDAYRPQMAVDDFKNWALDLEDTLMKSYFYPDLDKSVLFEQGYIDAKSGHSRGSTLDLTLFDMTTEKEVDMGGTFDYFGIESHPDYTETITEEQYNNRMILNQIMTDSGFKPLDTEWWHFTLVDEPYPDTYFNFPVAASSLTQ